MDFSMVGPAIALGLPTVGSCIGCWIAGAASHAAMARVEEGHGKFIAVSAAPSSIIIYGFLLMFFMKNAVVAGTLSPVSAIGIAIGAGSGMAAAAIFQAKVCATAIQASVKQPAIYGKCWVSIGLIESFALFAFVFGLMLIL